MTSPAEITNEERMARWLDDFAADRAHFGDCSINGFEFKRLRDAAQVIRRLSALSEGGDQLALTCERLLWLIETEWKKDGQYITVDARAALARYAPYRKGGE